MTGDTARTITEDELAEALRELKIGREDENTFYPAVAGAVFAAVERSREPEYEPGAMYHDPEGRLYLRTAGGWLWLDRLGAGEPRPDDWVELPLRKLVPAPDRDVIYATLADGIERESVDLLADRIVRLLEERHE